MAKHIRNYARVRAQILRYYRKERRETEARLRGLVSEAWRSDECPLGLVRWEKESEEDFERRLMAEKARRVAGSTEYLKKDLPKWEKKELARLEAADKAGKLLEINISVNWTKSRTWGMNPHAECWVCFEDAEYGTRSAYSEGRASGAGYDKRSAAVQEAFEFGISKKCDNADRRKSLALAKASLDRFVIEQGEGLWNEYAVDKSPIPHFNIGGKGMSTFTHLFRRIGCRYDANFAVKDYLIDYSEPDRGSDVYHVIRKDRI